MIKCKLCGIEIESDGKKSAGRVMHGHLNRVHYEEYKKTGFDMEQLTEGYRRKNQTERNNERSQVRKERRLMPKQELKNDKPKNLRLLNKSNPEELSAYNEGYRYLDPDEMIAYTREEVKEEGWIE